MLDDGYKKTEIGVIPVEWDVVKLENISELTSSKRVHLADYVDVGIPFYRGKEITLLKKNETVDDLLYISEEQYNKIKNQFGIPKKNDILITAVGTLANIYRIPNDNPFYFKDGNLIWLKGISENSIFIDYILGFHKKQILDSAIGSSQKALTIKELKKIKIPLPPLKEQEKIADILSTTDDKIDAIASQIQKAQTLKKGLLQKLLSEGLGHSEFKDSELGKIPTSWKVVELDNVAKLNKQKYTPTQSECINYIGLEHINEEQGTIKGIGNSNDTLSQKNCFNKGEILFGKLRPYLRKFYLAEIDGVCSTEILVIKAKENILNSILFQVIKTEAFIEHSISKVFGTKMPRTSWAILQEYKLGLPPLEEQKQIADILSTSDEKLKVLRAKKKKYETLKEGLLQKLLSGEVRV